MALPRSFYALIVVVSLLSAFVIVWARECP